MLERTILPMGNSRLVFKGTNLAEASSLHDNMSSTADGRRKSLLEEFSVRDITNTLPKKVVRAANIIFKTVRELAGSKWEPPTTFFVQKDPNSLNLGVFNYNERIVAIEVPEKTDFYNELHAFAHENYHSTAVISHTVFINNNTDGRMNFIRHTQTGITLETYNKSKIPRTTILGTCVENGMAEWFSVDAMAKVNDFFPEEVDRRMDFFHSFDCQYLTLKTARETGVPQEFMSPDVVLPSILFDKDNKPYINRIFLHVLFAFQIARCIGSTIEPKDPYNAGRKIIEEDRLHGTHNTWKIMLKLFGKEDVKLLMALGDTADAEDLAPAFTILRNM